MHSLIIAGSIQSLFLGVFLFLSKRGTRSANVILGLYLWVVAYFLLAPELIRTDANTFPHLVATAFPLLFVIGPLLFFYIRSLFGRATKIWFHFLLSLLVLLYFVPFYLQPGSSKLQFLATAREAGMPYAFSIIWLLACTHILIYMVIAFRRIKNHNESTVHYFSNLEAAKLTWLQHFLLLNVVVWTLYLAAYILLAVSVEVDAFGRIDEIFAVTLSCFIYYLSFEAMQNPRSFPGSLLNTHPIASQPSSEENSKLEVYATQLKKLMEQEKPFLDPELSLPLLAGKLNVSPRLLSSVINEKINSNFFDFVNHYRVEETKKKLMDSKYDHLTILAIGLESGFSSKSTFNEVFKKIEKVTPSEFKKAKRQ